MALLLGKKDKAVDPRTLQFRALRVPGIWKPPTAYSWDAEHPGAVTTPMFANDRYGDCVIAARAHQTLRFERDEQSKTLRITDQEVIGEYLTESGGVDSGLVMLYSLRDWRNRGWVADAKPYRIHSFLEVHPQDHDEVREAMMVGTGLQFGVRLPLSAADQMDAGQVWDLVSGERGVAGSWGGHAILSAEYDADGFTFVTWGKKQKATWRWLDAYCDEAWLVIDDIDAASASVDTGALVDALDHL